MGELSFFGSKITAQYLFDDKTVNASQSKPSYKSHQKVMPCQSFINNVTLHAFLRHVSILEA